MRAAEPAPFDQAVSRVRGEGLVAYPTETVWGLGADACSETALARLRAVKGRDADQPISLLVTGLDAAGRLGARVEAPARRLARAFWPGPLTLVLPVAPGSGSFVSGVARSDGAVGLRCSPHPLASALAAALERAGVGPLTATSLNRSGERPATHLAEARRLCAAACEPVLVLDGSEASAGPPSTVVDLTGSQPVVLRPGPVDEVSLRRALGQRS